MSYILSEYSLRHYIEEERYSRMSFKNAQAYNDWHEWVESLSNYEKGLPDEPITAIYLSTRFDIKNLETK